MAAAGAGDGCAPSGWHWDAHGMMITHQALQLQPGQEAARQGLALEQRSRQGTTVSVQGLFCSQSVRRKALLAGG